MPDNASQIEFLRKHAKRLHEMAVLHKIELSPEFLKMAEMVDARVARLNKD
jgi:hypothetical protein